MISEVVVGGVTIGIHGGGAGERTWTGLTFQVPDVVAGAQEVVAGGGQLSPGTATRRRRTSAPGHVHRPGGKRVYVNAQARVSE